MTMQRIKLQAYLTIDDSPSRHTDALVDFLTQRDIPALLFVRGDLLEANPAPIKRAIQKGLLIGNHTYSHPRISTLSLEDAKADILKCETLIENLYKETGLSRPHKTFRFSYLDRGCGPWVVDFEALTPDQRTILDPLFFEGLNFNDQKKPSPEHFEKKQALQDFLAAEGYSAPFKNIEFDWWKNTEIAQARDCCFTYSTSDWMLTQRHLENKDWPYKSTDDLKRKINEDAHLNNPNSAHIILAHDQEDIFEEVCTLITHLQTQGFTFLDFE